MNILIFTNTYLPHVGGVARSVEAFTTEYRRRGHGVLIVAPEYPNMPEHEEDMIRIKAIENFNASDFSLPLPVHSPLRKRIDAFGPDIVHSQHPFLLGMTALRVARSRKLPLVFTHHTLYEQYTHYVPGDSAPVERFAIELATRYANLTDRVFAPSESIRELLRERGVTAPIDVVPTGIHPEKFASGDRMAWRKAKGIPEEAFVVGHLGRLALEKNLEFLAQAVAMFVADTPHAHFLVVGTGPAEDTMREAFAQAGAESRLHNAGILKDQPLVDALHAMDVFAFTSKSETQGIVLTEAMAAGLPVVALDAPGAREVVADRKNGRLLHEASTEAFSAALQWVEQLPSDQMRDLREAARATAESYSMACTADKALEAYEETIAKLTGRVDKDQQDWETIFSWVEAEWYVLKTLVGACGIAVKSLSSDKDS